MDPSMNYQHQQQNGYHNPNNMVIPTTSSYQYQHPHPHHQYLSTAYQNVPTSTYPPNMPAAFPPNNVLVQTTQPQPPYVNAQQYNNNIPVHNMGYHSSQPIPQNLPQWQNNKAANYYYQSVEHAVRNPFDSGTPKKEKASPHCLSPAKPKKPEPSAIEIEQAKIIMQLKNDLEITVKNSVTIDDHNAILLQNTTIGTQNQTLFSDNEKLRKQIANLQLQLEKCNEKHKTERSEFVGEIIKWQDKYDEEAARGGVLISEKSEISFKANNLEAEITQLKLNLRAEEKAKREYSSAVSVLRDKTGKLTLEIKEKEIAHDKELKKLRKEFGDKVSDCCAQIELLSEENVGHVAQIDKLQNENSELLSQIEKLKEENVGHVAQIDKLQNENSELLSQIEKLKEENVGHVAQIDKLQNENSELLSQIEKLKEENVGHVAQIDKLQNENSELLSQIEKLKEENVNYSDQVEKLESNLNEMNVANANLPVQSEQTVKRRSIECVGCDCEAEIRDLWDQYRRVEKEKRKLSKGLQKVQEELQCSQEKCCKLEKKLLRKKIQVENSGKEPGNSELIQSVQTKLSEGLECKTTTIENQGEELSVLIGERDKESFVINLKRKIDSIRKLQPQLQLMIEADKQRCQQIEKRMKVFELETQRNDDGEDDSEKEQITEKTTQTAENQKEPSSNTRSPLSKLNK